MTTTDSALTSLKSFMIGNFALNLLLSASLQQIWGMINVLQIIVNLPLFAVTFPPNARVFFSIIISLSEFDVLPASDLEKYFFYFGEEYGFSPEFDSMDILKINLLFHTLNSITLYRLQQCQKSWEFILYFCSDCYYKPYSAYC